MPASKTSWPWARQARAACHHRLEQTAQGVAYSGNLVGLVLSGYGVLGLVILMLMLTLMLIFDDDDDDLFWQLMMTKMMMMVMLVSG